MKAEIIGYITAMINNHTLLAINMKNSGFKMEIADAHEFFKNELEGLLDFADDIPDEINSMNFSSNDGEVKKLKSTIRELEDSCENMNEVEKNLHEKIEELKENNAIWQTACIQLRTKLEYLDGVK